MYKLGKHRGDAMISAIIASVVTGALCFGVAKTVGTTMQSQSKVVGSVHATTYADSRINVIKNTPYSELTSLAKTKIDNTGDTSVVYYESVELKEETTTEPIGRWAYVNIYEGENDKPVDTFRYFVLKDGAGGVPKGSIIMWSGSEIPNGWAICDGGVHNGTKVPDMRDKFIVGAGKTYSLKDSGGSNSKTLTIAEMPAHNYGTSTQTAGDHVHSRGSMNITGNFGAGWASGGGCFVNFRVGGHSGDGRAYPADHCDFDASRTWSGYTSGILDPTTYQAMGGHSHTITSQGSGQAIDIRPEYLAVYYIIKL